MFKITDVVPSVVRISNKKETKLTQFADFIKIKGFITDLVNLHKLEKLNLSIGFGDLSIYTVPFYFLLNYNNNVKKINNCENQDNYFIEFPHDLLLRHKIPLIALKYSPFFVFIEGLNENIVINMVLDNYIIHMHDVVKANNMRETYYLKIIQEHKIKLINYKPDFCDYESEFEPYFLTQGIIIKSPKQKIINMVLTINKSIKRLDYDNNLINIYGENIGDNLTYFGFNMDEKFTSDNMTGTIALHLVHKVIIKIRILNNTDEKLNNYKPLEIYTVEWNKLKYANGFCGFEYMKTKKIK